MPQTVVARLRPSAFRKIPWRRLCCGLSRTEILREQSNPNAQASIKCDLIRFFILGTRLNVLAGVVGFGRTGGALEPPTTESAVDEIAPGTTVIVTDAPVVRKPVIDSTYFAKRPSFVPGESSCRPRRFRGSRDHRKEESPKQRLRQALCGRHIPGGSAPTDTLPAAQNIARYPWYEPERLFALLEDFYPVPSGKAWQIRSNTNVPGLRFRRAQVENPDEIPRPKFRTEDKLNLDNALRRTSLRWKFQARPQHTTQFSSESMTFLKP